MIGCGFIATQSLSPKHFQTGLFFTVVKRDEIPFGILENHGYTSVYFKGETKIGEWVCIVLWNKEYAPVVLDSVISKSFWLHNVDASLIPECIYAAIKDSIFETVKRLNMPNATERIERSNYIFNREVNI